MNNASVSRIEYSQVDLLFGSVPLSIELVGVEVGLQALSNCFRALTSLSTFVSEMETNMRTANPPLMLTIDLIIYKIHEKLCVLLVIKTEFSHTNLKPDLMGHSSFHLINHLTTHTLIQYFIQSLLRSVSEIQTHRKKRIVYEGTHFILLKKCYLVQAQIKLDGSPQ